VSMVFKDVFGMAFDGYSELIAPDAVRNQRLQPRKEGENRCNIGTRDVCIHIRQAHGTSQHRGLALPTIGQFSRMPITEC